MDRAPLPHEPEEPIVPEGENLFRRKRFLNRLRGLGADAEDPGQEHVNPWHELFESALGDDDSKEGMSPLDDDPVSRTQLLGHRVLEQAWSVHEFAQSLGDKIEELPLDMRTQMAPETERLNRAANELEDVAVELDEELEELEEATAEDDIDPRPADNSEFVPPAPAGPEKARPQEPKMGVTGMARLVIATLIGGGLGVLVGEGNKKERSKSKEKPKPENIVQEQKAKIATQEAELGQLRSAQPEANVIKKEYVQKAGEFTERQVDLTNATVEQVREVVKQVEESEKTFKIPEAEVRQTQASERQAEIITKVESVEKLREDPGEKQDNRGQEAANQPAWQPAADSYRPLSTPNPQPVVLQSSVPKQDPKISKSMIYVVLLVAAGLIAIGLSLFK